jgi:hypothetical protein
MGTLTATQTRHTLSASEGRQFHVTRAGGRQPATRSDSLCEMPDLRIDWDRVRIDADKLLAALCWPANGG